MVTTSDASGNTVVWFSETNADAIGALVVSPSGQQVGQVDFPCVCAVPRGMAMSADGALWAVAEASNQVVRLTPNASDPLKPATVATFQIPSGASLGGPRTSEPHSVAVDHHGRVWFTEAATAMIGFLDPASASP